jgi:RNA polymerase sigma-70 factor (ECF subfamily)
VRSRFSPETSDAALVALAQQGDRDALEALLRRHHDRIRAVCRRLAGATRDADDAVQETMIKVVRSLESFDGRSSFGTWVYRIATNTSLDELRRRSRRPALHMVREDHGDHENGQGEFNDERSERAIEQIADRMSIDQAIEQLPEEYRVAVILRDVADLDYAEISEVLGIPVGTVKSRIARGRMRLSEDLGNPTRRLQRPTPQP